MSWQIGNCSCVRVAQVVMTGEWEDEDAQEVLQLSMGGCTQIDADIRQTFPGSQYPVQVAQVVMTGEWEDEDAKEVLQLGMGGCAQIDAYKRQCLKEALSSTGTA